MDLRRESARVVRAERALLDPANRQILTAHVLRSALIYDPNGWKVTLASSDSEPEGSPPGLTQLMRMADTLDLGLFVNVGSPSAAREQRPNIMEIIDDSGYFEIDSRHPGLEPHFERIVYRYSGGPFDFDFDSPK